MQALVQHILPAGIYGYAIALFHMCVCTYVVHTLWLEYNGRNDIGKHQATNNSKIELDR